MDKENKLGEKLCPKCDTKKFVCEFYVSKSRGDGRSGWCKACTKIIQNKKYKSNPELRAYRLAYSKEWQKRNPEKMREYGLRWRGYYKEYHAKRRLKPEGRYQNYKDSASKRGINFEINLAQFSSFENRPCWYCAGEVRGFGIDRVDSDRGYLMGNLVSCCRTCNWAKSDRTKDQFISMCLSVALNHQHGVANS